MEPLNPFLRSDIFQPHEAAIHLPEPWRTLLSHPRHVVDAAAFVDLDSALDLLRAEENPTLEFPPFIPSPLPEPDAASFLEP